MAAASGCGNLEVMGEAVLQRAGEVRELVASLLEWRDPVGVLSVTVGIEAGAGTGGTPPWAIAVQNDLARARREGSSAVRRRLDEASVDLEELLDQVAEGRGRALYVALDTGARRRLELEMPLPSRARVGPVAHVLPLLQALSEGAPAGLVMVSKDGVVVLESELAQVVELERLDLEPWVGDWWPEMKGPSRANPLRGQHAVSQRDRYSHRVAVAYDHTRRAASETLAALAADRGWTRAVLAGDPRTVDALDAAVREGGVADTARIAVNLEGVRAGQALVRLEETLAALTLEVSVRRARAALEEAAEGVRGAGRLGGVLQALADARVASLLLDAGRTFPGFVEPAGGLRPADGREGAVDLTDLMVARALETGADVVPLGGAAAVELDACDGVVARLRW
jgi:hypothetical protein